MNELCFLTYSYRKHDESIHCKLWNDKWVENQPLETDKYLH
jgi:hypothetical protein